MKTFLRRFFLPVAVAFAPAAAPLALAAPPLNVTITAPAAGNLGVLSSPNNSVTFSATATPSGGGAFITNIDFRVNGVSVGAGRSVTASPLGLRAVTHTMAATNRPNRIPETI